METNAVESEVPDSMNVMETSDGKVTFSLEYSVGNLIALLLDEHGNYSLVKMDRSEDRSPEPYLEILQRWVKTKLEEPHQILDVGELILDDSDPFIHYLYLDDNLLGVVTTYPIPGEGTHIAFYRRGHPDYWYYLHMGHQLIVPGKEYTVELAGRLSMSYLNERTRTSRE